MGAFEAGGAADRHRHLAGPRAGDHVCPDPEGWRDPGACPLAGGVVAQRRRARADLPRDGLGAGGRAIVRALGLAPSTVRRGVRRNGGALVYPAVRTEQVGWRRTARPNTRELRQQPRLRRLVAKQREARWSQQ